MSSRLRAAVRRPTQPARSGRRFGRHADGYQEIMPFGFSIFLVAVGAILRYAVTASVSGIELPTVGLILMIVGIVGLLLSIAYTIGGGPRRGRVVSERVIEQEPGRELPPY